MIVVNQPCITARHSMYVCSFLVHLTTGGIKFNAPSPILVVLVVARFRVPHAEILALLTQEAKGISYFVAN